MCGIGFLQSTTLSISTLGVDFHEHLTCPIQASIKEFMHVCIVAVPEITPRSLLFLRQRPTHIAISFSSHLRLRWFWAIQNLDITSYTLFMALPLWLLVSVDWRRSQCLRTSSTLGSLGPHHQWRHKSRVSLKGPPSAHDVSGTPFGELRDSCIWHIWNNPTMWIWWL